jgi:hypothetical protein
MSQLLIDVGVFGAKMREYLRVVAIHEPVIGIDTAVVVSDYFVWSLSGSRGSRHGSTLPDVRPRWIKARLNLKWLPAIVPGCVEGLVRERNGAREGFGRARRHPSILRLSPGRSRAAPENVWEGVGDVVAVLTIHRDAVAPARPVAATPT